MLDTVKSDKPSCFHCGLPLVAGSIFSGELGGDERQFCCPACRAVASTIFDSGLGSFYRFNEPSGQASESTLVDESFARLDDASIQQQHVVDDPEGEAGVVAVMLLIGGIHCAACIWLLEKYLAALPGVVSVSVSQAEQTARIRWRRGELSLSTLFRAIAGLGYEPQFYAADSLLELQQRESRALLRRLGVAGLAMMQVGMFAIALYAGALQGIDELYRDYLRWISALMATPVVFYSAQPFFRGAWRGIRHRSPGMDVPVAIAIGFAYLASLRATLTGTGEVYFDSVAMFTFLLLSGRFLEMRARHSGATIRSDLNSLLPALVVRLSGTASARSRETVPLNTIVVGDEVLVKAGQVVPVDGVVTEGRAEVSESQLSGEFIPLAKGPGDEVLAGSVVAGGVLTVSTRSVGQDLKIQTINGLLARAQLSKPRLAHLADRIASVFVVCVLLLALATWIYWRSVDANSAFWIMLSVLVVSCPCALSLATPAALTAAGHRLRRLGLLVTRGEVWEKVATISDVICDKTGTLTRGELSIADTVPLGALDSEQCLVLAAALEACSDHPIARAFHGVVTAAPAVSAPVIEEGRGIHATIAGVHYRIGTAHFAAAGQPPPQPNASGLWVLLADSQRPLCWFRLQDRLRDDADQCVATLKALGFRLHLLSGDSSGGAEQLAQALGFDACRSGVSPADKLAYVNDLQQRGRRVLMIGDGINDIPVLAAADVSVAMANASNLAKTQADAIALSGRLTAVIDLFSLSAATRRTIRQNLLWALLYNASAIPLAAVGWVPPWAAALGMSLSSLVVVANALRLQRRRSLEPTEVR